MMLTILGSIAEFEPRAKADQVFALDRAGKTREAIAKEVGISVFRILRIRKDAEKAPVVPVTRIRTRPQVSA